MHEDAGEPLFHEHDDEKTGSSVPADSAKQDGDQIELKAAPPTLKKGEDSTEVKAAAGLPAPSIAVQSAKTFNVVVFDGNPSHDWVKLFAGCTLADGSLLRIVQVSWMETAVAVYHGSGGCMLNCAPVRESEGKVTRPATMTVQPHFCIVRNQPRGPTPASDRRHVLYGLQMAGVPAINSFESMLLALERPVMYGELRKIEERVGHERFPLIPQTYYSDYKQMVMAPSLPCVVKVSHAHAGMGKIKLETNDGFRDLATVLALNNDYCTAEKFFPCEYGIRVQKIGSSYRVLKKVFTGAGWKSQFGGADLQEIPLTQKYKLWADECSKCFGGLDLLAVDALCFRKKPLPVGAPKPSTDTPGDFDDVIIELNDTAIGILGSQWMEETKVIRDLAIERMNGLFVHGGSGSAGSDSSDSKPSSSAGATAAAAAAAAAAASSATDWNAVVAEDAHKRLLRRELDESKAAALHAQAEARAVRAEARRFKLAALALGLVALALAVAVAVVAATR